MPRVRPFFHYLQSEEYQPDGGMWRTSSGLARDVHIAAAAELMRAPVEFEAQMLRATREWPNSCAANLRTPGKNRRAWIGHAGCFLGTGSPEECTRIGWHRLTPMEQRRANAAADRVIKFWLRGAARQLRLGEVARA